MERQSAMRAPLADRILAVETNAVFLPYSAVLSGINEIREALANLSRTRAGGGPAASRPAILFIDEIHRWNKGQQDALLPFVPENYFPETLGRRKYYEPSEAGHEKVIADRLKSWWGQK